MVGTPTPIQRLRNTAAVLDTLTLADGVLVWDQTNKQLRVHDGATLGGNKVSRQADIASILANISSLQARQIAGVATGTVSAIVVTNISPYGGLSAGNEQSFVAIAAPAAGATTLSVDGTGVLPLTRADGSNLQGNEWVVGQLVQVVARGSGWQLNFDAASALSMNRVVGSIAALRAMPAGTVGATANVLGRTAPGDGSQLHAYWNATSTAADTGDSTSVAINPAGNPGAGRWLIANISSQTVDYAAPAQSFVRTVQQRFDDLVNVQDFALPSNPFGSGGDDSATVLRMITYMCQTRKGGDCYIPPITYKISQLDLSALIIAAGYSRIRIFCYGSTAVGFNTARTPYLLNMNRGGTGDNTLSTNIQFFGFWCSVGSNYDFGVKELRCSSDWFDPIMQGARFCTHYGLDTQYAKWYRSFITGAGGVGYNAGRFALLDYNALAGNATIVVDGPSYAIGDTVWMWPPAVSIGTPPIVTTITSGPTSIGGGSYYYTVATPPTWTANNLRIERRPQDTVGTVTAGNTTITVTSSAEFAVNEGVAIFGAGVGACGDTLFAQIQGIPDSTHIVVDTAPGANVAGAAVHHFASTDQVQDCYYIGGTASDQMYYEYPTWGGTSGNGVCFNGAFGLKIIRGRVQGCGTSGDGGMVINRSVEFNQGFGIQIEGMHFENNGIRDFWLRNAPSTTCELSGFTFAGVNRATDYTYKVSSMAIDSCSALTISGCDFLLSSGANISHPNEGCYVRFVGNNRAPDNVAVGGGRPFVEIHNPGDVIGVTANPNVNFGFASLTNYPDYLNPNRIGAARVWDNGTHLYAKYGSDPATSTDGTIIV